MPVEYRHLSDEVVDTIFPPPPGGNTDPNGLFVSQFTLRKQVLTLWLSDPDVDPIAAAGYRARLRSIDANSARKSGSDPGLIVDRLGLQCVWDHFIRGGDAVLGQPLQGIVDPTAPWHTRFWMGGWDGDLLVGWMQGRLDLPLVDPAPAAR